ncbi:MAG: chemotaxis protein CheR, partial [Bacteroidota bacterium]|nr:chemotaxis protein CheR [Bacteroidota bacterium]
MKKSPTAKTKKTAPKKKTIPKKKSVLKKETEPFPIVAIGASAGGLEAVSELLKNLPAKTGMAYIYVQHLSKDHKSQLPEILSGITKMKVQVIQQMEHMFPDNVYVIPSTKGIEVTDGHIRLLPRAKSGESLTIDVLFSSLAETHQENVIGVILSGNGHDGTIGLQSIRNMGGITFAQDDSASNKSMPEHAIATEVVDFVLSPKEIALKLAHINKNGILRDHREGESVNAISENDPDLNIIFKLLHKNNDVDFSHYKMATVRRRIQHRMLKSGVDTIKEYA